MTMKVAHVATVDISLHRLLLNQLCSIQAAGYEVVGISSPGKDVPALLSAGIRHIPVPMTRRVTPLADLLSLLRLYSTIRREHVTIVHTHTAKAALLGQLAARLAGVPVVVNTIHGFCFHDQMHPWLRYFHIVLERLGAYCSDLMLSQNQEDMHTAISEGICSNDRIKHLGNGIDLSIFNPDLLHESDIEKKREELGIPSGAKIVGFVGRLSGIRKGFLDFLRACQQLAQANSDIRFLIVGEHDHGKADGVGTAWAEQYGISDRCHYLGAVPNSELPTLYALMNVLVLPSSFEGIPRVVMEASAMRVPAVVTDVKGNREAVEHGRNGLLVPWGNVSALVAAISDLLADPEKACCMGREGSRIARERFDERLIFQKVIAEYAQLVEAKGLGASTYAGLDAR